MTRPVTRLGGVAVAVLTAGVLFAPGAAADDFPVFGLPAAPGQNIGSAGIHSDNGSTGVKNAIDLNPRDDVVRAPLGGTVQLQHCDGGDWVTIGAHVHFTLWRIDTAARSATRAGNWDNVSYRKLETTVAEDVGETLSGRTFGGWTLQEGTSQYSGTVTNVGSGQVVRLPGTFSYDG